MKRFGIERQTLLASLIPILVMAALLESYFVFTRFADLERSLLERSQLLTRQLASASEYAMFSGNQVLLKQNADAALAFKDVRAIAVFDDKGRRILLSANSGRRPGFDDAMPLEQVYQDDGMLRLAEPIMATQIDLDGLAPSPVAANRLGTVAIEISKQSLNNQKNEFLLISLLTTLLAIVVAMVLALKTARSITTPILHMHHAIRRIGEGDLETRISQQSKIYELHELIDGLNEMMRQLLRDRDMLESRVEEATTGFRRKKVEVEQVHQEKERLNEDLAMALGELRAIMEANPDILYVFNLQGELTQWNSSLEKFFNIPPQELMNMHVSEFVHEEDRAAAMQAITEVYARGSSTVEVHLVRHDGVLVPYMCNGVILKNVQGEVIGFTGTGRDISERKAAAASIHHMAHYDMLTDLPNRSLLTDRLHQALAACKRERTKLAVMFLDLDMFKFINDKHGHDIGDMLLKEAANRMLECLRESDTAARIGGDEFVILLPSIESTEAALLVAEKIRHVLCLPFDISGYRLNISTSIGIALYPEHGATDKILLKNADTAMYLGKQQGRNTVVVFPS